MKLFNCIDRKDVTLRNKLFRANGEEGYVALMKVVSTFKERTIAKLSRLGDSDTQFDPDEMTRLTTTLFLCDELLELNGKVKKFESKNTSDED